MMVKDHGAANAELKDIAASLGIGLPTILPPEKMAILSEMEGMKEFDRNVFYAELMVKEHEEAGALFENGSKSEAGKLQAFAAKHLPSLKAHYAEGISNQKKINSKNNN